MRLKRRVSARIFVVIGLALFGTCAVVAILIARPPVLTTTEDVTIECAASTAVSADECRSWGATILAAGPPSMTFELKDLVRIAFDRPFVGLAPSCRVEYYISRYADEPAWSEETPCFPGGSK